jgi:protein O-mannosyl-transferase
MGAPTISTDILINHLRETLSNPDNKICFVLGAGASVESGVESGSALAKQWYNELPKFHLQNRIDEWKEKVKFDEKEIPSFYSKLFRLRYEGHPDDGIHFISSTIEKGNPGFGYTILSQVLQRTSHNVVVTTNFDTLTEESLFVFTNKRALVCNHENVAHLARPGSSRPLIVKIHRGLYMDPLNDQDEVAEMKPEWKKALTNIFKNYIPIVIGYGGNDGSLMNYLKNIESCQRMYWCLNSDKPIRQDIKEVVERHKGSFVLTGGFNRLMFRFIDLFDLTKMHEVLEKLAKERAEKLRKEFEEAGKDIGLTGTKQEKHELGKVAEDFDSKDWLQWELKAAATSNPEEKKSIYLKALSVLPRSYQLQYNFGCWLSEWGHFDEAIEAYQKAVEIEPDYQDAWYNMGISYNNKGDHENAIEAYRKTVEIKPDYHEAWYNTGISYNSKGDYDNTIVAYRKAVEIKPDYQDAWYNMGISYNSKGDYDNAIEAYRKAVEIKPDYQDAWYNMGNSYRRKSDNDNAIAVYMKAIEIKPDYQDAWNNLGISYNNKGEYESAIEAYRKAVEIKPDYQDAWYNMGSSYHNKGDHDNAIAAYRRTVEIKPDYHQAWYNMGISYKKKGDIDNARKSYSEALRLDPNDPDYKKAVDSLGNK